MEKLRQSRENEEVCFARPEGSIDFFEYKRRERERERERTKQIPRGAVSAVPFYVITRNQCPLFPFIPYFFSFPPSLSKTKKRKNVFEGKRANYRALSTLIDRYPSEEEGEEVWINGRERMVGASAGKGLGGRQKRKRDGGRMKEQSGIVNGSDHGFHCNCVAFRTRRLLN